MQQLFSKTITSSMYKIPPCIISRKIQRKDVHYFLPWYNPETRTPTIIISIMIIIIIIIFIISSSLLLSLSISSSLFDQYLVPIVSTPTLLEFPWNLTAFLHYHEEQISIIQNNSHIPVSLICFKSFTFNHQS